MARTTHVAHRHLMRAERAFGGLPVHHFRSGPALRRTQNDHGPARPFLESLGARPTLDAPDVLHHHVECGGHLHVHAGRVVALDEMRGVTITAKQRFEFIMRNPRQHRRPGDLVAVQMKDRQHRAVVNRIEELVRVPRRGERSRLRFAIADHARDEQVRVVKRRAESVRQRVAQFTAFMNRPRCLGRHMARNAAGEGKLFEQPLQPVFVLRYVGIDL